MTYFIFQWLKMTILAFKKDLKASKLNEKPREMDWKKKLFKLRELHWISKKKKKEEPSFIFREHVWDIVHNFSSILSIFKKEYSSFKRAITQPLLRTSKRVSFDFSFCAEFIYLYFYFFISFFGGKKLWN